MTRVPAGNLMKRVRSVSQPLKELFLLGMRLLLAEIRNTNQILFVESGNSKSSCIGSDLSNQSSWYNNSQLEASS